MQIKTLSQTVFQQIDEHLAKFPVAVNEDVMKLLLHADTIRINDRRDASAINLALMRICRLRPWMDFSDLEKMYRAANSQTYLVAAPLYTLPPNTMALLPNRKPANSYLWVGVNGLEESIHQKSEFGLDDSINLERLKQTGFIVFAQ